MHEISPAPLLSGNEVDFDVAWFSPQSEYRPTEYLQGWVRFWFDDARRLLAAKSLQRARLQRIREALAPTRGARTEGFEPDSRELELALARAGSNLDACPDVDHLLTEEARLSRQLFRFAARATRYGEFTRAKDGRGSDPANRFLDHGNYLAYGLAATATWVLGLPHGLAVLHGKTRRGGLVFDVADLVKACHRA